MIIRLLLLITICLITKSCISQSKLRLQGLYRVYSSETSGYFYFKEDSSIIYVGFQRKKDSIIKDVIIFNDTINKLGRGKWWVEDSFFVIRLGKFDAPFLNSNKTSVTSYSTPPFDSLIVKFHINFEDSSTKERAFISFKNGRGDITDKNGRLQFTMPLHFVDSIVTINGFTHYNQVIQLTPENNVHEIEVTLAKLVDRRISVIQYRNYSYKLRYLTDPLLVKNNYNFRYVEGGKSKLRQIIDKNILIYPIQKHLLQAIASELEK
ncbi:MAG: hypothetical protein WKF35_07115 [Ferruginibacter sp.]